MEQIDSAIPKTRNPVKRLYNWVLSWAEHPVGIWALFILAFIESSVFPIPPDVLLIALAIGKPKMSFRYAFICSIGSILGGMFGYFIGWQLWQWLHNFFFNNLGVIGFTSENFDKVQQLYDKNAFLAVFGAAFTPIPYKVFTIAGGVCQINFGIFILASAIGRSMRFFAVAGLIFFVGPKAKELINKYFNWFALLFFALIVLGFLVLTKLVK